MIIIVLCLIVAGLVVNILDIREKAKDYNFANEYYDKFKNLIEDVLEKKTFNNKEYSWLVSNSDKMQYILGDGYNII